MSLPVLFDQEGAARINRSVLITESLTPRLQPGRSVPRIPYSITNPFQIYQHDFTNGTDDLNPDPAGNDANWRTFRVHNGYTNGAAAFKDDSTPSGFFPLLWPTQIIVPESSTYYVWLVLSTTYNSKPVITYGATWWNSSTSLSGANQTDGSGNTYIPLGTITVGADSDDPHTTTITMYVDSDIEIVPGTLYPFEVILAPDTGDPDTDWRLVEIYSGTVNGTHPDNDSTAGSPLIVSVPESTDLYKFWLALTLDTSTGDVTAITIENGEVGWQISDGDESDYPDQPPPASADEYPPAYYILLSEVTTSDDTDKVLTRYPTTLTSLAFETYLRGLDCNSGGTWTRNYAGRHYRS